jgi:hypothetical protein
VAGCDPSKGEHPLGVALLLEELLAGVEEVELSDEPV